ncbi:MAG: cysteine desulfurase [Proteobacteria bacterium]|nr:cysteine desulfurase [Pseudomonadota bacterium]
MVEAESAYDVARVRDDFAIFEQEIHGNPLVFLDSAASAQKPRQVIEALRHCYEEEYANIHRGVYDLSERATEAFEAARVKVQRFLNAGEAREIVFVRGGTEGINLVASSYGRAHLGPGDEIILSHMEHHSNIVPWQMLRAEKGVVLRIAPIDDDGNFLLDEFEKLLNPRTRLVAITHASNALGTIVPVKEVVKRAHAYGVKVLVDGCQAVVHMPVDVQDIDCDFYVFSGHKLYGPTGIGALYGKAQLLESMPPYQGGGEMIRSVRFEATEYNVIPHKFEAGTPHIAGAIGLGAAIDYVSGLGLDRIGAHEQSLLAYATERIGEFNSVRMYGTAKQKASILSFTVEGVHPHDVGTILDRQGIAVRAGHHCAQPVMDRFGIAATVRASFGLYNTVEDIDALTAGVATTLEIFG